MSIVSMQKKMFSINHIFIKNILSFLPHLTHRNKMRALFYLLILIPAIGSSQVDTILSDKQRIENLEIRIEQYRKQNTTGIIMQSVGFGLFGIAAIAPMTTFLAPEFPLVLGGAILIVGSIKRLVSYRKLNHRRKIIRD